MESPDAAPLLLVEDDALLREALAAHLEAQGYEVRRAADRAQALERAAGCALALIDLGLPPQPQTPREGLTLIETLRQTQPHMLLLVLTGQEENASALAAIERGAFDFLLKPITPEALDQALARAMRYCRHLRALARQGNPMVMLSPQEVSQGLREAIALTQEKLVRQTLEACGGNVTQAAQRLGLPRTQLYYYLDKFGIQRPRE